MIWRVPKIWEGGDCWIIGGGPSVSEQFEIPSKTIEGVSNGTMKPASYAPYLSYLQDKHVIGVNAAYLLGESIVDIVFFGDNGFYLSHQQGLADFKGIKVCCQDKVQRDWIKNTPKDTNKSQGITTRYGFVSWNGNSGAAAINLAYHLGAKRIFLLGFDMKLNNKENEHWHDVYGRNTNKRPPHKLPFARHLLGFPVIARDAKQLGIEIINVNPNSAIEDFPRIGLKQII